MNQNIQDDIWKDVWKEFEVNKMIELSESPYEHQIELKKIIDEYSYTHREIIEVGCGTGITSLILDDNFNKTLFDKDEGALFIAKSCFNHQKKRATFILGDMFRINTGKKYDIVYNSGVIEHFSNRKRIELLGEYGKILKQDGILIIAFPNLYSFPYRFMYCLLNLFGKWKFPKVEQIYDMKNEINYNNLVLIERKVVAKETSMELLKSGRLNYTPLFYIFKMFDKIFKFEGYLTVLIIKKGL